MDSLEVKRNNNGITFSIDSTSCKGKIFLKFFINSFHSELYEGFINITGDDDTSTQYTQKMINFIKNKNPESLRLGHVTIYNDHFEVETAGASCNFNCNIKCKFDFYEIRKSLIGLLWEEELLDISGLNKKDQMYKQKTTELENKTPIGVPVNTKQNVLEPENVTPYSIPMTFQTSSSSKDTSKKFFSAENKTEPKRRPVSSKTERATEKKSNQSDFTNNDNNNNNNYNNNNNWNDLNNTNRFSSLFNQITKNKVTEPAKLENDVSFDAPNFLYNLLGVPGEDSKKQDNDMTQQKTPRETLNFGDVLRLPGEKNEKQDNNQVFRHRKPSYRIPGFGGENKEKNIDEGRQKTTWDMFNGESNKSATPLCYSKTPSCNSHEKNKPCENNYEDPSNILSVLMKELFKQQQQ